MDSDIFAKQKDWLDKARAALTPGPAPTVDLTVPLAVKQTRIEAIAQRIKDLSVHKLDVVRGIDAAIAESENQLANLQAEVSEDKKFLQGVAVSTTPSTGTAGTAVPSKEADADTLPSKDAAAGTPTKEAQTKTPPKSAKTKTRTKK
jgi:hypothetical protein